MDRPDDLTDRLPTSGTEQLGIAYTRFHAAAVSLTTAAGLTRDAATASRMRDEAARWRHGRDLVAREVERRGFVITTLSNGNYCCGRPADFQPITLRPQEARR